MNTSPIPECAQATPARLCKTRYNTTAPMYGVSLTSGQPVTIVQKFPDLLQQVVFEVKLTIYYFFKLVLAAILKVFKLVLAAILNQSCCFLCLKVCESSECDVVRGECTQTYVPYLFLVIPLGPVTLTGQDYVLVESGCVCRPKYAGASAQEANAISSISKL